MAPGNKRPPLILLELLAIKDGHGFCYSIQVGWGGWAGCGWGGGRGGEGGRHPEWAWLASATASS